MVRDESQPAIIQRENERKRLTVDGKRIDDRTRCTLLAVREIGGTWALYPHGWDKFGIRLDSANAETLARGILADDAQ